MKRVLKRFKFNLYLIRKVSWLQLFKLSKDNSSDILMIWAPFPKSFLKYMTSGAFENDFALLQSMIQRGKPFHLILGGKKLYNYKNKTIFFNLSGQFHFENGLNYVDRLHNFQKKLLANNNILIPSHEDSLYWENKIYMHKQFETLNISHPKTIIVDSENRAPKIPDIAFPILFKPAHSSGSTGIQKINSIKEYQKVIVESKYKEYMLQEWIDMRRDLRLIYIGEELVLHYWRINGNKDWRPTSTGHGSSVDFITLPDKWLGFLFEEFKKLNLRAGAFDVTWNKDDLKSTPKILEVSPSFMPNPKPEGKFLNRPYSEFKKSIWGEDAYYKKYIDLVFELKMKLIKVYDNEY